MQRKPRQQEKQNNGALVYHPHDEISGCKYPGCAQDIPDVKGQLFYGTEMGHKQAGCADVLGHQGKPAGNDV